MSVGDAMTIFAAIIVVILGGRAVAQQTWANWIKPMVSSVWPARPPAVMSNRAERPPSEAVSPRTDAPADGRTTAEAPALKPATLDTAKSLRAHGYNRDQARAFLKTLGWSLGNDTWAAAGPSAQTEDEDLIVTPYAGRVTSKKFYPDQPELEYQELET